MNRSILIVICDFLLVSLLAFSTVDINKATDTTAPRQVQMTIATNQPDSNKDLAAAIRLALDEERKGRDQLVGELARARETAGDREKLAQAAQAQLQSKDQENARLQRQQTELQQQFADAQTNVQTLSQQLQSSSAEALLSRDKLAAMEAELRKLAVAEAGQVFEAVRARIFSSDKFDTEPPGAAGLVVLVKAHPALQVNLLEFLEALPRNRLGPWACGGWEGVIKDAALGQRYDQLLEVGRKDGTPILKTTAAGVLRTRKQGTAR